MRKIWTSRSNVPVPVNIHFPGFPRRSARAFPFFLFLAGAALMLAACAGGSLQGTSRAENPSAGADSGEGPDFDFLNSEAALEASEYLRLGRERMQDSAWFEASEYLDSAMIHLSLLEMLHPLSPGQLAAVQAYQDSVRAWLVESVNHSGRAGEAEEIADYIDHEIEEVSLASLEDLEALLPRLRNSDFELEIPSPIPNSVLQAMRVFTGSGRGYFERWLQRKGRYEEMVLAKLEERGMPRDLIYLAMIESGFNPRAWSHASASGMWQFISATGRRYGLDYDWWEDARRDPVRATDAALSYLEDLYAEFGDWHQAMAAYNSGEGRVRRQLRLNPEATYWDMRLPRETRYYVPKILAAMIIGRNPEVFGFDPTLDIHPPLRYDTVTVAHCLPLEGVAKAVNISEDSLRSYNPALRRWCTPPARPTYMLYLPEGSRGTFLANYASIDTLARVSIRRHVIARGHTLSHIAARYGVSVSAIQRANNLRGTRIRAGQALTIPVPGGLALADPSGGHASRSGAVRHRVRGGETLSGLSYRYGISVASIQRANNLRGTRIRAGQALMIPADGAQGSRLAASRAGGVKHTVRSGETLSHLSEHYRVSIASIRHANNLRGTRIRAGQSLAIPGTTVPVAREAVASAPEPAQRAVPRAGGATHTVRGGHTLSYISARYGVSVAAIQRANNLRDTRIRVGQVLSIPGTSTAHASAEAGGSHVVRRGENLIGIARRYDVTVSDLRRENGMTPGSILLAGRELRIPAPSRPPDGDRVAASRPVRQVYRVRPGDNLSTLALRLGVTQNDLMNWNGLRSTALRAGQELVYHVPEPGEGALASSEEVSGEYYHVRRGENLWVISSRFGNSVEDLKRLNDGLTDVVHPGQRIRVR